MLAYANVTFLLQPEYKRNSNACLTQNCWLLVTLSDIAKIPVLAVTAQCQSGYLVFWPRMLDEFPFVSSDWLIAEDRSNGICH
jgi:hypothetical protein